jgi:type III secretion protein V
LLLITTLFRLAIEVSATRLILLKADGGDVIAAFGNFVVAGNLVVGAVVFLILTFIQFIVISKGSERVAEVGARFTLDAMPGKQMSIDAELRAGHIDHVEARRRRAMLARESQFFGSMDGAMKFVKGDAIAGIVVLLTNVIGGLVIGVVQRGMDIGTAAKTYTVLTIGEGLVSQIPALIISTSAGILVTRVSSEEEGGHLGSDIGRQILAQPKALAIAAGLLALIAIVPGMPTIPFLGISVVVGFLAYRLIKSPKKSANVSGQDGTIETTRPQGPVKPGTKPELPPPVLTPICIELSPLLTQSLLSNQGPDRLTTELIPNTRERYFIETGIPMPSVRIRPNTEGLLDSSYSLRLQEIPMATGKIQVGHTLVMESPGRLATLGIEALPAVHPAGLPAVWVADKDCDALAGQSIQMLKPEEIIFTHLLLLLRQHGHTFIGIQETQLLLDGLEKSHPALVHEVVPKLVSPVLLADVLRRLAEESISLRGLREILGALAEWAPVERDPVALTEHVRGALRRQITFKFAGPKGVLAVFLLEPMIEQTVREAIQRTPTGSYLALEPEISRDIILTIGRATSNTPNPVILTTVDIRRFVRRLVETEYPKIHVVSYQELSPEARLQPLGHISIQSVNR